MSGHPDTLTGYYKWLPENNDTMYINATLYLNGVSVASAVFSTTAPATTWTAFKVPFSPYVNADSGMMMLAAQFEGRNPPQGNSVLYVDNLNFGSLITGIASPGEEMQGVSIYPNPAVDYVKINLNENLSEDMLLLIYDEGGRLLKQEILVQKEQRIDISWLAAGTYSFEIHNSRNCGRYVIIKRW